MLFCSLTANISLMILTFLLHCLTENVMVAFLLIVCSPHPLSLLFCLHFHLFYFSFFPPVFYCSSSLTSFHFSSAILIVSLLLMVSYSHSFLFLLLLHYLYSHAFFSLIFFYLFLILHFLYSFSLILGMLFFLWLS